MQKVFKASWANVSEKKGILRRRTEYCSNQLFIFIIVKCRLMFHSCQNRLGHIYGMDLESNPCFRLPSFLSLGSQVSKVCFIDPDQLREVF